MTHALSARREEDAALLAARVELFLDGCGVRTESIRNTIRLLILMERGL